MADETRDERRGEADAAPPKEPWALYALLLLPFVGTLWVPFYNRLEPRLGGVPFFYWYQFVWIGIGAALNGVVYLVMQRRSKR